MSFTVVKDSYPNIVKDGLVLNVDAGSRLSYSGSGTTWNDISGNGNNYSSARTAASKIAMSQGMKIIGQNYYQDNSGNWTVTLKVKSNKIIIVK